MTAQDRGSKTPLSFVKTQLERIERAAGDHPLRFSFLLTGVLFAVVLLLVSPVYETNDDAVMSMIVSGTGIGTSPDEHLVFTNFLIGLALKQLYIVAPKIPWYGIYLLSAHYLANVAVMYSILTWRYRRVMAWCFLLLFTTISTQLIIRLQFTSTAMWVTECGVFVAMTGLCRRHDDAARSAIGMLAAGAALMIFGSMVRFEPYIAAMAVAAFPCVILVWQLNRSVASPNRTWHLGLATIVLSQCAVLGLLASNNAYYDQDAGWREFFAYNPYRVKFNDYQWTSFTPKTKPVFDRVQWTLNDYELISKYWYFDDDRVFSRGNLQSIVDGFPWAQSTANWRHFGQWWFSLLIHPLLWPIWMQLPIQLWYSRNPRSALFHTLVIALSIDVFVCGLMLLKAPVIRMCYPLFASQILFSLLFMRLGQPAKLFNFRELPFGISVWWQQNESPSRIGFETRFQPAYCGMVLIGIALLGSIWSVGQACRLSQKTVDSNKLLRKEIAKIRPKDDDLYVCWGSCFPYESLLPLDSPRVLRKMHLLSLGWTQKTPVNSAVKKRFQIDDLAMNLVEKKNVYLVSIPYLNAFYAKFLEEHYDLELKWTLHHASKSFEVWKPSPATFSGDEEVSTLQNQKFVTPDDVESIEAASRENEGVRTNRTTSTRKRQTAVNISSSKD